MCSLLFEFNPVHYSLGSAADSTGDPPVQKALHNGGVAGVDGESGVCIVNVGLWLRGGLSSVTTKRGIRATAEEELPSVRSSERSSAMVLTVGAAAECPSGVCGESFALQLPLPPTPMYPLVEGPEKESDTRCSGIAGGIIICSDRRELFERTLSECGLSASL